MSKTTKAVRIKETELVNLIDKIVTEAVEIKKKEWLAEQASKGDKTAILETRLSNLEAKLANLGKGK
jgi:hypothetical protein